jgi:hypothetical protein
MRSGSGRRMLFEQIGEAPSAQRLSSGIDEHVGCRDPGFVTLSRLQD